MEEIALFTDYQVINKNRRLSATTFRRMLLPKTSNTTSTLPIGLSAGRTTPIQPIHQAKLEMVLNKLREYWSEGLAADVKILEGERLRKYVKGYGEKWLGKV